MGEVSENRRMISSSLQRISKTSRIHVPQLMHSDTSTYSDQKPCDLKIPLNKGAKGAARQKNTFQQRHAIYQHSDEFYMNLALEQAYLARANDEVPVGAVVVYAPRDRGSRKLIASPQVISFARNRREEDQDPKAHAEFLAIEEASWRLGTWRLEDCIVYVTLEPCLMCAGLMIQSRISRCVYGAADPKGGALGSVYRLQDDARLNHSFLVSSGVCGKQCSAILHDYFSVKRERGKFKRKAIQIQKSACKKSACI